MKILVISDNHGNIDVVESVVRREQAQHIIHCGDFCTSLSRLPVPEQSIVVRGNCDTEPVPAEQLWKANGIQFLVIHGHQYRVNTGLTYLQYKAEQVEANIICFGHTHNPCCIEHDGRLYVNPGSVVQPRGFNVPTYARIELQPTGAELSFFTVDGERVPELSRFFSV